MHVNINSTKHYYFFVDWLQQHAPEHTAFFILYYPGSKPPPHLSSNMITNSFPNGSYHTWNQVAVEVNLSNTTSHFRLTCFYDVHTNTAMFPRPPCARYLHKVKIWLFLFSHLWFVFISCMELLMHTHLHQPANPFWPRSTVRLMEILKP